MKKKLSNIVIKIVFIIVGAFFAAFFAVFLIPIIKENFAESKYEGRVTLPPNETFRFSLEYPIVPPSGKLRIVALKKDVSFNQNINVEIGDFQFASAGVLSKSPKYLLNTWLFDLKELPEYKRTYKTKYSLRPGYKTEYFDPPLHFLVDSSFINHHVETSSLGGKKIVIFQAISPIQMVEDDIDIELLVNSRSPLFFNLPVNKYRTPNSNYLYSEYRGIIEGCAFLDSSDYEKDKSFIIVTFKSLSGKTATYQESFAEFLDSTPRVSGLNNFDSITTVKIPEPIKNYIDSLKQVLSVVYNSKVVESSANTNINMYAIKLEPKVIQLKWLADSILQNKLKTISIVNRNNAPPYIINGNTLIDTIPDSLFGQEISYQVTKFDDYGQKYTNSILHVKTNVNREFLLIRSTPDSAVILNSDTIIGVTPYYFNRKLLNVQESITLSYPDFTDTTINDLSSILSDTLQVSLTRLFNKWIITEPSNSCIYLSDEYIGTTPLPLTLDPGNLNLALQIKHDAFFDTTITFLQFQNQDTILLILEKIPVESTGKTNENVESMIINGNTGLPKNIKYSTLKDINFVIEGWASPKEQCIKVCFKFDDVPTEVKHEIDGNGGKIYYTFDNVLLEDPIPSISVPLIKGYKIERFYLGLKNDISGKQPLRNNQVRVTFDFSSIPSVSFNDSDLTFSYKCKTSWSAKYNRYDENRIVFK